MDRGSLAFFRGPGLTAVPGNSGVCTLAARSDDFDMLNEMGTILRPPLERKYMYYTVAERGH